MKNWKLGTLFALFVLTASLTACASKPADSTSGDAMKEEPGSAMKEEPGSAMKEEPGSAMKEEPGSAMEEPATAPE